MKNKIEKSSRGLKTAFAAAALAAALSAGPAAPQSLPDDQQSPPSAPAARASDIYDVIAVSGLKTGTIVLPEAVLPPPGPHRDALRNSWPRRDVEYKNYLILLKNDAGNYAQCAGVHLSTRYSYYNYGLNNLGLDIQTNDRDVLQILRRNNTRTDLPAWLGGCTAISAAEAGQITNNNIGIRIGFTVEASFDIPLYGLETAEETVNKQDIIQNGRGVSLRWATGSCSVAGWNDAHANAQPGQSFTLRGFCPR